MTEYTNYQDVEENKEMSGAFSQQEKDVPVEKLSDSAFYRMYINEIRSRTAASEAEQQVLYQRLAAGDTTVASEIVDSWLMRIVELSKFYRDSPVNVEDVIQEGNMGLWIALTELPEDLSGDQVEEYLLGKVKHAMEAYIREVAGEIDQEQSIVAKAALLYSAQEHLAKENGEVPSNRQLSDFTHIPLEEVEDILSLLKGETVE